MPTTRRQHEKTAFASSLRRMILQDKFVARIWDRDCVALKQIIALADLALKRLDNIIQSGADVWAFQFGPRDRHMLESLKARFPIDATIVAEAQRELALIDRNRY